MSGGGYASLVARIVLPAAAQPRERASVTIPTVLRVRGGAGGRWWRWGEEEERRRKEEADAMERARKLLEETHRKPTWWERVRPFRIHRFKNGFAFVWNTEEASRQESAQKEALARILAAKRPPAHRRFVGGVWEWVRRLLKIGVGLATMQPLALAVIANLAKLILVLLKVATKGFDMDFDDVGTSKHVKDANSTTTFADVVGVDEAKHELEVGALPNRHTTTLPCRANTRQTLWRAFKRDLAAQD